MRFRRSSRGLEEGDLTLVAGVVLGWGDMDDAEQRRLVDDADHLLRQKRWEAARGFELSQPIRVHVAAQASLLILGLDYGYYDRVRSIVVHPTRMTRSRVRPGPARGVVSSGPVTILGEAASGRGPVVIAWDSVRADTRHHERGHNVVFHEFAHKIDMLDDVVDGTPPLEAAQYDRWVRVCTEAFERVRAGDGPRTLRDYAAVGPGEFFAVATEVFFSAPRTLRDGEPDLYDVLCAFYRQDPVSRRTRDIPPGRSGGISD
jgi:MtfA peptidase